MKAPTIERLTILQALDSLSKCKVVIPLKVRYQVGLILSKRIIYDK